VIRLEALSHFEQGKLTSLLPLVGLSRVICCASLSFASHYSEGVAAWDV
jgi:hypothetical protein